MRHYTLFILVFCLSCNLKAQQQEAIDVIQYLCSYTYTFQQDSSDVNSVKHQDMVLQIGHNYSKFCSANKIYQDSLLQVYEKEDPSTAFTKIWPLLQNRRTDNLCSYVVYKNYPEKNNITFLGSISKSYFKVNQTLNLNWEIEQNKDTIILGYHCLSATVNFAGRNYIAWFSPDIPIKEGPYKFSGLPGLIIKIGDSKNQHVFILSGFKKINSLYPLFYTKMNYIEVTNEGFNKAFYTSTAELYLRFQNEDNITFTDKKTKMNALKNIKSKNNLIERY